YCRTRAEGFGAEVKRRILVGTYVLSHGYYDAYYLQAQKIRRLIAREFAAAFELCDVIMGPTSPSTAFELGTKSDDPVQMYLGDIFTVPAPLAGLPALSVPCGFDGGGLPVGLQLMGDYFSEALLLGIAHRYQQASDWHLRVPKEPPSSASRRSRKAILRSPTAGPPAASCAGPGRAACSRARATAPAGRSASASSSARNSRRWTATTPACAAS